MRKKQSMKIYLSFFFGIFRIKGELVIFIVTNVFMSIIDDFMSLQTLLGADGHDQRPHTKVIFKLIHL